MHRAGILEPLLPFNQRFRMVLGEIGFFCGFNWDGPNVELSPTTSAGFPVI